MEFDNYFKYHDHNALIFSKIFDTFYHTSHLNGNPVVAKVNVTGYFVEHI